MVMVKVNVAEAKAKLSEYLDRVLAGEQIVICRHNSPIAELRAIEHTRVEPRPLGPLAGQPTFDVPPSFFAPLPDAELDLWEGDGARESRDSQRTHPVPPRVAEGVRPFGAGPKRTGRRRTS
jgi:prevent-host-death family protein